MTVNVLLAIRDAGAAALLESSLNRYGFDTRVVVDGHAALAAFEAEKFDVVLLDTWLAKKNGITLAAEMRASLKGQSAGICLVNGDPGARAAKEQTTQKAGADAWFDLPFALADVRRKIAELAHRYTGAVASGMPISQVAPRQTLRAPPSEPPTPAPTPAAAPPRSATPLATPRDSPDLVLQQLRLGTNLEERPASHLMLLLCRARVTGVLVLRRGSAEAKAAFLRGVPVGAGDNGHDNRIGARLVRHGKLKDDAFPAIAKWREKHGGRIGDAILGLGLVPASVLLDELREQGRERLTQIATWRTGEGSAKLVTDEAELLSLAVDGFDIIDVILNAHLRFPDEGSVTRFVDARGNETISTTLDFEEGLLAYARAAPKSPLPMTLMSPGTTLRQALTMASRFPPPEQGSYAAHLVAVWHAGLIRLAKDPAPDTRPLPRPWRPEQPAAELVNAEAVDAVQRAWLRVQGRSFAQALRTSDEATVEDVASELSTLEASVGAAALKGKQLGPAEAAARELAVWLEDARKWLQTSAEQELAIPLEPSTPSAEEDIHNRLRAEEAFLEGKLALLEGKLPESLAAFEQAAAYGDDDAEMLSWLGWARFLEAVEQMTDAIALIKRARYENPTAARPILFLAQVAEQQGDLAAAESFMREALRRCPDDPDVLKAAVRLTQK